ncbi:MAG: hypothetical protein ACK5O2_13105 [Microthrixaceae bacterium]
MPSEIHLRALQGSNPLGFLAALGVVDAMDRNGMSEATLRWEGGLIPHAVLRGPDDMDQLVRTIDEDRASWNERVALNGPDPLTPATDIKPELGAVRSWIENAHDDTDLRLIHSLLSEEAEAGNGDAKPTHLHFTAGQQKFLLMAQQLRDGITAEHIVEAIEGPWTYESELPVLGWDNSRGERIHALRGFKPSGEKKTGVPGADWLALLGLRFLPVATNLDSHLLTTRCTPGWKKGSFDWPLWDPHLPSSSIGILLSLNLDKVAPAELEARGITAHYKAAIRRADQGGYGSFGPSSTL